MEFWQQAQSTQTFTEFFRSENAVLFIPATLRTFALILHRASHSEEVDFESPTALAYE